MSKDVEENRRQHGVEQEIENYGPATISTNKVLLEHSCCTHCFSVALGVLSIEKLLQQK